MAGYTDLSVPSGKQHCGLKRSTGVDVFYFTKILIKCGKVINVRFVAVRRVDLIKVGSVSKAKMPQNGL